MMVNNNDIMIQKMMIKIEKSWHVKISWSEDNFRSLLGSTRVAWGGGRPGTVGGGASDDAGAGESKDAATKAEVQALRDELRDTKRQMGNILLLFGKLLGLQQEGHQQLEQRTRTRTAQQSMETKTEPQADSDNESANSSASDEELGDEEDDIAII